MVIRVDTNGEATAPTIPEWMSEILRHDAFIANYIRVVNPKVYDDAMQAYREWMQENVEEIHNKASQECVKLPKEGSASNDDFPRGIAEAPKLQKG